MGSNSRNKGGMNVETKNKSYIKKIGSIVGIIILAVIFNSMTKGAFASQRNNVIKTVSSTYDFNVKLNDSVN